MFSCYCNLLDFSSSSVDTTSKKLNNLNILGIIAMYVHVAIDNYMHTKLSVTRLS